MLLIKSEYFYKIFKHNSIVGESDETTDESINKSRSPSSPTSSSSLESSPSPQINAQISNTKLIDTSKQTLNENLKRKLKLKSKETNNCV